MTLPHSLVWAAASSVATAIAWPVAGSLACGDELVGQRQVVGRRRLAEQARQAVVGELARVASTSSVPGQRVEDARLLFRISVAAATKMSYSFASALVDGRIISGTRLA